MTLNAQRIQGSQQITKNQVPVIVQVDKHYGLTDITLKNLQGETLSEEHFQNLSDTDIRQLIDEYNQTFQVIGVDQNASKGRLPVRKE